MEKEREREREIEFWRPFENECLFKLQNNQAVNDIFNQRVMQEIFLSSDLS